jgi:hypothetical protein
MRDTARRTSGTDLPTERDSHACTSETHRRQGAAARRKDIAMRTAAFGIAAAAVSLLGW